MLTHLSTCDGDEVRTKSLLKISLAGANNSVPTTGLTPCIIIVHVYHRVHRLYK